MVWPLSRPLRNSYSHTTNPRTISTEMDAGPQRDSLISTDDQTQISVTFWVPTAALKAAFWVHWDTEGHKGVSWFDMELETLGVCAVHEVKLKDPRFTPQGRGWLLSARLVVRSRV